MDRELEHQLMTGPSGKWQRFRESRDPVSFRILIWLVCLAAGLAFYLILGAKPWDGSILKRLSAGRD